jgi:hypothetical protein
MKDETIGKIGKASNNLIEGGRNISTEPKDGYMKPKGSGSKIDAQTRPISTKGKYLK